MSFIFDTNDAYIYTREYTDETLEFCGKIKKPEEMWVSDDVIYKFLWETFRYNPVH